MSLESKPKQSQKHKIDRLLNRTQIPSSLCASFFHMIRRYLDNKSPANSLEEKTFAKLSHLSPEIHKIIKNTLDSFQSLSNDVQIKLFDSKLLENVEQANSISLIQEAVANEILGNVGIQVFHDSKCGKEEHPGKIRTLPNPGGEFPPAQVLVCRINGLRTATFIPTLTLNEYSPNELHQRCEIVLDGNQPKQICQVQKGPGCPGDQISDTCLLVQEVSAGSNVLLEGVNFSSINTKIRLTDVATFSKVRDVDAKVCGDDETPLRETLNGENVVINDCRVHDLLSFRVPEDLEAGLYEFQVFVPNTTNVPGWGGTINSNGHRIIITSSSSARYQISSETLHCRKETAPASIGSDEVGIKILAVPIYPNLTTGAIQEPNGGDPIRFGDVDSGEQRGMNHSLFMNQQPIIGVALSIRGFEVDSEEAFEREIDEWTEVFIDILKDQLVIALANLGGIEKIAAVIGYVYLAIAALVILAIDLIIALWAPADPIIEDIIGPTVTDLSQLTSTNFPLPPIRQYVTAQGIKVKVTPLEKIPGQYREVREYISDDEESRYEIVLRYNQVI